MSLNFAVDVVGWVGSAAVVTAYALVSSNKLEYKARIYQALNLIGGVFLVINTLYHGAYPSTFVNTVWAIIAIAALSKVRSKMAVQANVEVKSHGERH